MAGPKRPGPEKKVTEEVMRDIERAVGWGWSLANACDYADVAERTFYDYQKANPGFRMKLDLIRQRPELAARRTVAERLEEGDLSTSKWFLGRRVPEFNPRATMVVQGGQEPDEAAVLRTLEHLVAISRERAGGAVSAPEGTIG